MYMRDSLHFSVYINYMRPDYNDGRTIARRHVINLYSNKMMCVLFCVQSLGVCLGTSRQRSNAQDVCSTSSNNYIVQK